MPRLRSLLLAALLTFAAATAAHAADVVATCDLTDDLLTVSITDVGDLRLASAWDVTEDGVYVTDQPITLATPGGEIAVPAVAEVTVDCDPLLHVSGTLTGLPLIDGLDGWGGGALDTSAPTVQLGLAMGHELEALGAPLASERAYLYFYASSHIGGQLLDGAYTLYADGEAALLVVDVLDPAFYVHLGGTAGSTILHNVTLGLVDKVGLGFSRGGNLRWTSTMPMWDGQGALFDALQGEGLVQRETPAHLVRSGKFALIPIPHLPANLMIDGEAVLHLGDYPEAAQAVLATLAMGAQEGIDLAAALAAADLDLDPAAVAAAISAAGNVNSLSFDVGPLGITLAEGAFHLADGQLVVAGRGFTPGAAMQDSDDPTLHALSLLTFRENVEVHGFVDRDGWSFGVRGAVGAGPFSLEDVTVVIDSQDGVRFHLGTFELDWAGFVEQLEALATCDFSQGLDCSIFGVDVALTGTVDKDRLILHARTDVWGLSRADFSAVVGADGAFTLTASAGMDLVGSRVSGRFTLDHDHIAFAGEMSQLGVGVALSGHFDWTNGGFELTGRGWSELRGFRLAEVEATVNNQGVRVSGEVSYQFGTARVSGSIDFNGSVALYGEGSFEIFGYRLANVRVSFTSAYGLCVHGDVSVGPLTGWVAGSVRKTSDSVDFTLTGRGNLRLVGYDVARVAVKLDRTTGLTLEAEVEVLGVRADVCGMISPNGDVTLRTRGNVTLPVQGFNVRAALTFALRRGDLSVYGSASARLSGGTLYGEIIIHNGLVYFSGSVGVDVSKRFEVPCLPDFWNMCSHTVRLRGSASLELSPFSASAAFSGSVYIDGGYFMGASFGIDSSGRVRVSTPFGDVTVDIL